MKYITKKQLVILHTMLIRETGGTDGIRDAGLLDSASCAPFQTFDGTELYPSVIEKAVRLGYGLICNHAFIDGNKRIGATAMLMILTINGITVTYTQSELIEIIMAVASGQSNYDNLLRWVKSHIGL